MADYDPMAQLEEDRPGKKKQFDSATQRLSRQSVRQATTPDSVQAGQYDRKTITLPPEQIAYIDRLRKAEGIGVLAFYRWLIDQGLQNYERGARPEPQDKAVHDLRLGHWSSGGEEDG
ncbi:MAG: hypothetical protein L0332_23630 [Chloroflexi bacterium]|nr:hypothetical protein [Chloroflexota bacterium]MCI0579463.1 hypothetical protein [Chloroflexota bacterium]MCI0644916.1 hypothetical protein [Chloroflexota bacterium]MCI0729684.1 hypothetical protein [Chloroflexota bacterium]